MPNADHGGRHDAGGNAPEVLREREHGPVVVDSAEFGVLGIGKGRVGDEVGADGRVGPGLIGNAVALYSRKREPKVMMHILYAHARH